MLLSWFDAKEAKDFGKYLAQFYMGRIPKEPASGKKDLNKKQEVLTKILNQAAQFKAEHQLNIYKKAQLGNAFKWALKEAGYDPIEVDALTAELIKVS